MKNSSLTSIATLPRLQEASKLQSAWEPNGTFHLWKYINGLTENVNKNNQNVNNLSNELKYINERNKLGFDLFPFKIYILPDIFRGGFNPNSTNWCTVRVRGGFVFTDNVSTASYVIGTDLFQNYAYQSTYPLSSSFDIQMPTGSTQNPVWFWIEKSTSGSLATGSLYNYYLRYGNNPVSSSLGNPTPWTNFPQQNSNYIPVGLVDCYTSASQKQALIRQFLETDVLSSGGGGLTYVDWDYSASIAKNTIVRIDLTRNDYAIPWSVPSGSVLPPLSGPTFICIKDVPSIASGLRDLTKNIYYPFYPTWSTSSIVNFSGSVYNDIFFREIGLPVTIKDGCGINGGPVQEFVSSIPVSSSYNYSLPYTG